jgi:hypothetical protein
MQAPATPSLGERHGRGLSVGDDPDDQPPEHTDRGQVGNMSAEHKKRVRLCTGFGTVHGAKVSIRPSSGNEIGMDSRRASRCEAGKVSQSVSGGGRAHRPSPQHPCL